MFSEMLGKIIDFAEVWIFVFPFYTWIKAGRQPATMRPVMIYLVMAFLLNLYCDILPEIAKYLPDEMYTNTIVYNIHSVSRFVLFFLFFYDLGQRHYNPIRTSIILLYIVWFIVYFTFYADFFYAELISGELMAFEAFLLLSLSLLYYLSILHSEIVNFKERKDFWVVTGLSIFCVTNFFVFLFYGPLVNEDRALSNQIWNFHNIAFIIFILLITKAIYVPSANKH